MPDTAYERIVDVLRGQGRVVKADNGKALAQCPAHDDNNPSLSIDGRRDGKGIVVKCHAGCETTEVVAAIGWTMADLFDEPKVRDIFSPRRDYHYPGGRRVHRKPGKNFPQSGNKDTDRSLFGSDKITDTTTTVYVVEGEKDVEAVQAAGGVGVCSAMGAGKAHHADWSVLDGKTVIVVPDRDDPGRKHAAAIVAIVENIAESVTIVDPVDGKDFADHFAAGHGLDDLTPADTPTGASCTGCGTTPDDSNILVNGYCTGCTGKTPFKGQHDSERPVWPPPSSPLEVARKLYKQHTTDGGLRTLLYWRGTWMRWQQTHWAEADDGTLRAGIYKTLGGADYLKPVRDHGVLVFEPTPWAPNKRKISDVLDAMQAIGHIPADTSPPTWLKTTTHSAKTSADQIISCTNGLLSLSTRTRRDHTPALFNTVSVPFDHDTNAAEPKVWLKFLNSIWPDDPDSVLLLQEYLGYVLSGRTDMQKLLLLIGPTRSGKGTIARMLTELIGRGHVAGPTLASLGTNFGLSPLLGKPLAVVSDARLGSTPAHTVVERLLSITGEDMLTVDRKFRDPWSGKIPTRFVILSNELPRFSDSSGAIANRLLILQMTNSFLGKEDRTLDDRLRGELPGILNWCLNGLDRLNRNGRFTVPGSSNDAAALMMDLASPVSAFVRDRCVREPNATVEADVLYSAWKQWAEDNGHRASAKATFGRDLRAVVPEIRVTQPTIAGRRVRSYVCIALLPVHPVHEGESAGQSAAGDGADSAFARADPVQQPEIPLDRAESPRSRCGCGNEMFSAKSIERGQCERCHLAAKRTGGAA